MILKSLLILVIVYHKEKLIIQTRYALSNFFSRILFFALFNNYYSQLNKKITVYIYNEKEILNRCRINQWGTYIRLNRVYFFFILFVNTLPLCRSQNLFRMHKVVFFFFFLFILIVRKSIIPYDRRKS